jgi:hypothetical protein
MTTWAVVGGDRWPDAASCRGTVPSAEFYGITATARAIACCASCLVRIECRDDEFAHVALLDEVVGYRAGMVADERRRLLQATRAASANASNKERAVSIRRRLAAGALVSEVAAMEGVDRRTISRWLSGEVNQGVARAG